MLNENWDKVDEAVASKVDAEDGKGLSSNDYTDEEKEKLANIEEGATADQTASEIKSLYESNVDTNAFTDSYKSKLDGIASGANKYTHPTYVGDDFSVDTGSLTGAKVVSDIDINVTTDGYGHVTDANGSVKTRTLTLADLGYSGETDATADQTASEILELLKTVDGSGSEIDADMVDGVHANELGLKFATGTYTGNDTTSRFITVGFTPKFVKVYPYPGNTDDYGLYIDGTSAGRRFRFGASCYFSDGYSDEYGKLSNNGFYTGSDLHYYGNDSEFSYIWEAWA
jgi:hypothetical protein